MNNIFVSFPRRRESRLKLDTALRRYDRIFLCAVFLLLSVSSSHAENPAKFTQWLQGVKAEASKEGILTPEVESAIGLITFDSEVIKLDRKQPEKTITFEQYKRNVLRDEFIEQARDEYQLNRELLAKVENEYNVPAEYIVALWGVESHFGSSTGNYSLLDSLATLAYEGRRAEFFRKELMNALRMLAAGKATENDLYGSWAGAMGQCQFMPSSYLKYAADGDGDGKADIWNSTADVFASIANYLKTVGWYGDKWGYKAEIPHKFNTNNTGRNLKLTLDDWAAMGVKKADGGNIAGDEKAALILIDNSPSSAYLVFNNFDVIMDWNRSVYFATSVGMLAEQIKK